MQRNSQPHFPFAYAALLALAIPGSLGAISEEEFFQAAMIDDRVQGQITASGVRYDRDRLVVTHPYLPFGSRVQVTNLENELSAIAEVVDRPYPVFHSVGLSASVAQHLGIPPLTRAEVSITTRFDTSIAEAQPSPGRTIPVAYRPSSSIHEPVTPAVAMSSSSSYRLQFGAFADPSNAQMLERSLNGLGIPAAVSTSPGGKHFRVVSLSTYANSAQAQAVAGLLIQRGLIREAIAVR